MPPTTWLTSSTDYQDHAVSDPAFEVGRARRQGTYAAVCGRTVIVCSLYTEPGPRCLDCLDRLAPPRRRRPWWSWRDRVPGLHRAVAADLADVLDVKAGLSAIVNGADTDARRRSRRGAS